MPSHNKLIIVVSGKKMAGKNTFVNQVIAKLMVSHGYDAVVSASGRLKMMPGGEILDTTPPSISPIVSRMGVRVLSFAESLKNFCVNVLGLTEAQCWGTDDQKNTPTHIPWESMPLGVRIAWARRSKAWRWWQPTTWLKRGLMTAREVMQCFGTDIVRKLYSDAWAASTYKDAISTPESLVFICDGRFPNEIDLADSIDRPNVTIKRVRMLRNVCNDTHASEVALDNHEANYDLIIPATATMLDHDEQIDRVVMGWVASHTGVLNTNSACE